MWSVLHVQVLLNMIDHGMDPQSALDAARFCIGPGNTGTEGAVSLEDGISQDTMADLRALGHNVNGPLKDTERVLFGKGQIICSRPACVGNERCNVWWSGSDGRGDGMAVGY